MSEASNQITSRRVKDAIAQMNPALKKLYKAFLETEQKAGRNVCMAYYRMGQLVNEAVSKVKYGEGGEAMKLLAEATSYQPRTLQNMRNMTLKWTPKEFTAIAGRRTGEGKTIEVGQLMLIASTACTKRVTDRLVNECFRDTLTHRDLQARIQKLMGEPGSATSASRLSPKKPAAFAAVLEKEAEQLLTMAERAEEQLFERLEADAGKYASQEMLQQLEEVDGVFKQLEEKIPTVRSNISAALERLGRVASAEQEDALTSEDGAKKPAAGSQAKKKKVMRPKAPPTLPPEEEPQEELVSAIVGEVSDEFVDSDAE